MSGSSCLDCGWMMSCFSAPTKCYFHSRRFICWLELSFSSRFGLSEFWSIIRILNPRLKLLSVCVVHTRGKRKLSTSWKISRQPFHKTRKNSLHVVNFRNFENVFSWKRLLMFCFVDSGSHCKQTSEKHGTLHMQAATLATIGLFCKFRVNETNLQLAPRFLQENYVLLDLVFPGCPAHSKAKSVFLNLIYLFGIGRGLQLKLLSRMVSNSFG